jgi:hypothetical protein
MIIMTALSNGWVTLWVFTATATATAMVPVLLPQLSLTMVLPVILAIPHTRSRFLPIMAVTVVMSLLLAWIGCFSPRRRHPRTSPRLAHRCRGDLFHYQQHGDLIVR